MDASILLTILTILTDLAIGAAAYKLALSNKQSQEMLSKLLTHHTVLLDDHAVKINQHGSRLEVLERSRGI